MPTRHPRAALLPQPRMTGAERRELDAQHMLEAPTLTEKIRQHAKVHQSRGMIQYHTHNAANSQKGFPDGVYLSPHGMLWREFKRECVCTARMRKSDCGRHPSPEQIAWLLRGQQLGYDTGIWTPLDLLEGRVDTEFLAVMRPGWKPSVGHLVMYDCICGKQHLRDDRQASRPRLVA